MVLVSRPTWTGRELALLRQHYPTSGTATLAPLLGRTAAAIRAQAKRQGLTTVVSGPRGYRSWTSREDEELRDLWGHRTLRGLARYLDRSSGSVRHRAVALGLVDVDPRGPNWTATEEAALRLEWSTRPTRDLAAELGRSMEALHQKAMRMGLTKPPRRTLTPDQVRDARARYADGLTTIPRLAAELGVAVSTVHDMLHRRTYADVTDPG